MEEDGQNAGAALGPVKQVQGTLFEEGLEEKRFRLEGQGTGKRGKHCGNQLPVDNGQLTTKTKEARYGK
jgi:hypothetical protein